jgi:glyoxylase-like metal-dependent hydrolase (beta-lactamase superfamily II)
VEVAPGAWAHLQLPGRWMVSNSGLVVGDDAALFVDTTATERRTRAMLARLDPLTAGRRRWLLLTHHHADHTFGAHLVGAERIIGHPTAKETMEREGLSAKEIFTEPDYGDVAVTLPTELVADAVELDLGGRRVTIFHPGPAHTFGDLVAWLPEERVLFAADLAFQGAHPLLAVGSVHGYRDALGRLLELEPQTVVPGHGEVRGPELLEELRDYADWVLALAGDGHADRSRFAHWGESERLAANVHVARSELAGEPPEPLAAMLEMLKLAGGVLHSDA